MQYILTYFSQGVPDLSVMIEEEPHLFIVLGEVSQPSCAVLFSISPLPLQQHKRVRGRSSSRSWRETKTGGESQLGQLLLYLLGGHLQRLRAIRHMPSRRPIPVLGLYLDDMKVLQAWVFGHSIHLHMATHNSAGNVL